MAKILVVDDEAYIRDLHKNILHEMKHDVDEAENGTDGFRLATTNEYDLILMDIKMPELNGVETIRSIKMVYPNQKIIVITGLLSPNLETECLEAGVLRCLTKPLNLKSFMELLSSTLG